MSTSGGYHEYIGGCSVHRRDIISTSGMFSTSEGYHEYIGEDIMSTLGDIMIHVGGYHEYIGGYHEYIGGIP